MSRRDPDWAHDPYGAGYDSARAGYPAAVCPYGEESRHLDEWIAGREAGLRERRPQIGTPTPDARRAADRNDVLLRATAYLQWCADNPIQLDGRDLPRWPTVAAFRRFAGIPYPVWASWITDQRNGGPARKAFKAILDRQNEVRRELHRLLTKETDYVAV